MLLHALIAVLVARGPGVLVGVAVDEPVFGQQIGGGAASAPFEKLFLRLGEQVGSTVESMGSPSSGVLERCKSLGKLLAEY